MGQVIYPDRRDENEPDLVLEQHLTENGTWVDTDITPNSVTNLTYLGNDKVWGDMFSGQKEGIVEIMRGQLNSGRW